MAVSPDQKRSIVQQLKYMLNGLPSQHTISHGASSSSAGF